MMAQVCGPQRERVRRETGKEYVVKVHCDEGVATHIGPEPCAGVREDVGEASAGGHIGQPSSREFVVIPGADAVHLPEGKMDGRANASAQPTRRGLRQFSSQVRSHLPRPRQLACRRRRGNSGRGGRYATMGLLVVSRGARRCHILHNHGNIASCRSSGSRRRGSGAVACGP